MKKKYKFLQPIRLGSHQLKNRVMMGSMHTGLEEKSLGRLKEYFVERAKGQVALIITGGFSPNFRGQLKPFGASLHFFWQVYFHKKIPKAVHAHGTKICLQLLHAGRYGYQPFTVAPSAIKAVINPFKPKAMSEKQILRTIDDFVYSALLARRAGYDGVEIMGSEGYLINQFLAPKTNHRKDQWGGTFTNRKRFVLLLVKTIREKVGKDFLLIFRLSLLDLVDQGCHWDEVVELAHDLEALGVDAINTGIGWHESKVPTIATLVPQGYFAPYTEKLKKTLRIPIIASNRINTPEIAQQILEKNQADMISMARPFLADSHWVQKTIDHQENEINTCIACNQACLDHIFENKTATCLVNPQACYETKLKYTPTNKPKKIAIIGGGVAGLSCAHIAALRGHHVTIFEKEQHLGGQFQLARRIPGKEEFEKTLNYYQQMLKKYHVTIHYGVAIDGEKIKELENQYQQIVIASGVVPRTLSLKGIDHPKVITYPEAIYEHHKIGKRVAIIGAGGIGFDVAELLSHVDEDFAQTWGIDTTLQASGSVLDPMKKVESARTIYLLQRKEGFPGKNLAKTTGWIRRNLLRKRNVHMLSGVQYVKVSDKGLYIIHEQQQKLLEVDHIVICAGQIQNKIPADSSKIKVIGGSALATELDAKRAIRDGAEVGSRI